MKDSEISRRNFLKYSGIATGALILGFKGGLAMEKNRSQVVFF